jgi:3-methyladenine DNA glycosylase AlkD
MRAVRRRYSRAWRREPAAFVLEASRSIARQGAMRWAAYELIRTHAAAFAALDEEKLAGLAVGLDSWESVDSFGRTLSGPAWVRGQVDDGLIRRWAGSPDRWLRRTALVSTIALNMPGDGGKGDPPRTLDIAERLVADRDDMVVKALSWALRSLAMRRPEAARAFLADHEGELAARVKRELGNKLRTGLKNPRA